jgi:hypothetical protein
MSSSKRHFTVVMRNKEHGLYSSSSPSSAARKAVSKLCADNKKKKVEFSIRETTQLSNKKVYGPYIGYMQKLDKPIELKGRVIRYKPIVKLNKKGGKMKGGVIIEEGSRAIILHPAINTKNPNHKNPNHISKIIHFDNDSEVQNFVSFETRLNEIDRENSYHIPFVSIEKIIHKGEPKYGNIQEYHYEQWLTHHTNDLNAIKKLIGDQNFQNITNDEREFKFNYLVTIEYGGIPIYQFINRIYNGNFIQILLGIVNIFNGILHFYERGINNCSITELNILFLPHDPSKMRMLNFKNYEPIINNSDTELKKMYLIIDIYDLLVILDDILYRMNYEGSLENIEDFKNKYNELEFNKYTNPSNNRNKVIRFFTKYPDLTTKETLDGIRSEILGIITELGGS